MFVPTKRRLLRTVREMQEKLCAYQGTPCDCKYGAGGMRGVIGQTDCFHSEQTGCPELRSVVLLLEAMTEKRYAILMKKGRGLIAYDDSEEKPNTPEGEDGSDE